MKNRFFAFLLLLAFTGCQKEGKESRGALSELHEFQVFVFFSPYNELNQELVFNTAVDALKQLGKVQISEAKDDLFTSQNSSPVLLLSTGSENERGSSIRLFAESEVLANHFKTACCIWKKDASSAENLPQPEIEDGKIVFKNEKVAAKADETSDFKRVLEMFIAEYREDNPKGIKPTFYVQKQSLL